MNTECLNDFIDLRCKPQSRRITDRITGLYFRILGNDESTKVYALDFWEKSKFIYFDNLTEAKQFEQNLSS